MNVELLLAPLHDYRAECVSLAAMLAYTTDLIEGRDMLGPKSFFDPRHELIFTSMVRLSVRRGEAGLVDLITLSRAMEEDGVLERAGGFAYLTDLEKTHRPVRGSVRTYAGILKRFEQRRSLQQAAYAALNALESGEPEQVMVTLEGAIAEVRAGESDDLISASEAVDLVNANLDPEHAPKPFATGLEALDIKTQGGIWPGELAIIGALPSRGKSSVARQIAAKVATQGIPTLVFSLEMTVTQWFGADQANEAGVPVWNLRDPRCMSHARREAVRQAGERMRQLPVWFETSSSIHIDKIVAKSRLAVLQKGVRLIIVDYAQRVSGAGRDRRELKDQLGYIALQLANLAKDEEVCVLLLSQLKRPPDINTKPSFEDLKESSYLGAHADTVLLNYRPVHRKGDETFTTLDQIIVAKQRHGPIGAVPVRFNGDTLRFDSREWTDQELQDSYR